MIWKKEEGKRFFDSDGQKAIDFGRLPKAWLRQSLKFSRSWKQDHPRSDSQGQRRRLEQDQRYLSRNNHRNCWVIEEDVSSIEGAGRAVKEHSAFSPEWDVPCQQCRHRQVQSILENHTGRAGCDVFSVIFAQPCSFSGPLFPQMIKEGTRAQVVNILDWEPSSANSWN